MRSRGLTVTAIAAALAAAGCADDRAAVGADHAPPATAEQTAERQRVTDRTQTFLRAMRSHEDARACAMMTRRLREGITFSLERLAEPGSCHTRATHIYSISKAPGHPGARIRTVTVNGGRASAIVTAPGGIESTVVLRKVAGVWKIANF
jgi:hypothetical protein